MTRLPLFLMFALCASMCFAIPALPEGLRLPAPADMSIRLPGTEKLSSPQVQHGTLRGKAAWAAMLALAESSVADLQCAIGDIYRRGCADVVDRNPVKAYEWYRKAALQGNATGMLSTGTCHNDGFGTAKDYSKALVWFCKGAELKDARCLNNLGVMHLNGMGTALDRYEAYDCFASAFEASPKMVLPHLNLGLCYHHGWGVKEDREKAYHLFCFAANHGVAEAQVYLVHYNMEGLGGLPHEPLKAYAWALLAKKNGHAFGEKYATFFEQHLKKESQKKVQTEVAKWKPAVD